MDHHGNFVRYAVEVCKDLEVAISAASGKLVLARVTGSNSADVVPELSQQVINVFGKSALFNAVRAVRILEHAADKVDLDRDARKAMLKSLKPFLKVRDANEHGHDPKGRKVEIATTHHEDIGVALDQVSMIVMGPEKILMGEVNLVDLYNTFRSALDHLRAREGLEGWQPVI